MRLLFLLVLTAYTLAAQAPRAQAHAFFGFDNIGGHDFDANSGGVGADVFVYKGAAVSPSGAWLYTRDNARGLGVFTINGSYHFLRGRGPFQPFVTAGYGALTDFSGGQSTFNYGGGANYWFGKHLGVRAEVLNFQSSNYRELTSIRFGISFR
jgi:hypothetical protein